MMTDTKEHIINTATSLFLQKGFKEVTMKQLVEHAGVSKGAFYHYFTSKEQVFEEVVLSFFNAVKVSDFHLLSTTSLKQFYTNWVKTFFTSKNKLNSIAKGGNEFTQNHYYIIFDGLRLVPSFRKMFDEEQKNETDAWITIIDVAKENKEIKSILPSRDIAKMFMYIADGLGTDLLMRNDAGSLEAETLKAWDTIYTLLQ
jgi:TetR/AcrR family transcriptional repressor of nem operon